MDNLNAGSVYGIQIQGTADYISNIFYNSVYIGGTHNSGTAGAITSAAFLKSSTGAGAVTNLKNNIFVNKRSGGNASAFHVAGSISSATGTLNVDYNLYYATGGSNSYNAGWGGTVFNDLAQYKTAALPNEQNTVFKNVFFVSPADLHLTDSSLGDIDLAAIPISGIEIDIDNDIRSLTTPYKGADEADVPIPVELADFSADVNGKFSCIILEYCNRNK
jgi:hypothetical protein